MIALFSLLIATLVYTSWVSYQRIGAFGCFDQCFNFVAAYFMLKGKTLYSQIFFNHQPIMAYLSYLIQLATKPATIYQLILYHRVFILAFSLFLDFLFIFRFRFAGILFVLFYETTKFYLMGNLFLPEAISAYLVAYLFGLWWKKSQGNKIFTTDYLIGAIFTWLIVFLNLSQIPLVLIIFFLFLIPQNQKQKKLNLIACFLFLTLLIITFIQIPLKDYFFDIFTVNLQLVRSETQHLGINNLKILKIFFYPLLILFTSQKNHFSLVLIGLDIIFLILIFNLVFKNRKIKEFLLIILILGLAAIRFVEPGKIFYETFHLLSWYSLFLITTFLLSTKSKALFFFLAIIYIFIVFSPQSFLRERVNRLEEFNTNFAPYFAPGTVIKTLSQPNDTLFLELWDDLIYWQAGLNSAFQYSLYTPAMVGLEKFNQARKEMFQNNPPDFYYSYYGASEECQPLIPSENQPDYLQLYFANNPSCLYIKKTKLPHISAKQWEEVGKLGFHLPPKK